MEKSLDPAYNRHRFYDAEHDMIRDLFQTAKSDDDWEKLTVALDNALANPPLPRWYRAEYEAIRAWTSELPEENIQRAKDVVEDMRMVMQAEDRDEASVLPLTM